MEAAPNREHIRNMAEARAHVKRDGGCYIRPSNCPDPSRCHAPMQTGAVIPQLAESQNLQQSPRPFGRVVHPDETIGKIGPTPVFGPPAGIVRVKSILPARASRRTGAPLFLLTN